MRGARWAGGAAGRWDQSEIYTGRRSSCIFHPPSREAVNLTATIQLQAKARQLLEIQYESWSTAREG